MANTIEVDTLSLLFKVIGNLLPGRSYMKGHIRNREVVYVFRIYTGCEIHIKKVDYDRFREQMVRNDY